MTDWETMSRELFMKDIVIPRAQEYIDNANSQEAFASIMSDMRKNKECREYLELKAIGVVIQVTMMGGLTEDDVTKFVNGMPFVKKEWELKGRGVAYERDVHEFGRRFSQ